MAILTDYQQQQGLITLEDDHTVTIINTTCSKIVAVFNYHGAKDGIQTAADEYLKERGS